LVEGCGGGENLGVRSRDEAIVRSDRNQLAPILGCDDKAEARAWPGFAQLCLNSLLKRLGRRLHKRRRRHGHGQRHGQRGRRYRLQNRKQEDRCAHGTPG